MSSFLVANVMRMLLTCHEEIGRVGWSGMSLTCPQRVVCQTHGVWGMTRATSS